jgi:hypothetical protein
MACAALMVDAAMACAGVNFMARQASAMTNCIDSFQVVPGLQSVARQDAIRVQKLVPGYIQVPPDQREYRVVKLPMFRLPRAAISHPKS